MRGKNLLWIAFALVFVTSLAPMSTAQQQGHAEVSVNPATISGLDGDVVAVTVDVSNVKDLYAWSFKIAFHPFASLTVLKSSLEGPFLRQGGWTFFATTIDGFNSILKVGCTLFGDVPGVTGSGTLANIQFEFVADGTDYLDLYDVTLIDSDLNLITSYTIDDIGAADLLMKRLGTHHLTTDTQLFEMKITTKDAYRDLMCRGVFKMVRDDATELYVQLGPVNIPAGTDEVLLWTEISGFTGEWTYSGMAKAEYSYYGRGWATGEKTKTYSWTVDN